MGKLIFTPHQQLIFDEFSKSTDLRNRFYFTGGTALSVFYYEHRLSEDMDFFSERDFSKELITFFANTISQKINCSNILTVTDMAHIFKFFDKENNQVIKIDFVKTFFSRIEQKKEFQGVAIDSLHDIGANKIMTVIDRTQIKDYVDLYFLIQKDFTIWDLFYCVEAKYGAKLDPIMMASDFMKVEIFENLPKMIKPLDLNELKAFFKDLAKKVASRVVE